MAELTNLGETPVHYVDAGVTFTPLKLLDDKNQPLAAVETPPLQIMQHRGQAAPGESVVLAEKIDLNRQYTITKPGKYSVQFNSPGNNVFLRSLCSLEFFMRP